MIKLLCEIMFILKHNFNLFCLENLLNNNNFDILWA